jgi:hypothetical protein
MDSMVDLVRGREAMERMLKVQLTEIHASFGSINIVVEHHFKTTFCTLSWCITFLGIGSGLFVTKKCDNRNLVKIEKNVVL